MLKYISGYIERKKKKEEEEEYRISQEKLNSCHVVFMETFGKCILELEASLNKPIQVKERTKNNV